MQTGPKSKLDAAMSAAEAHACSLKSVKPGRVLGQYGALLRRAALIEAHESLRSIEDPQGGAVDVARIAAAARLMQAHARLIEAGHRFKINQARLTLAFAASERADRQKTRPHEEQPHESPSQRLRRRSRTADYPDLSDAEIDAILREKDLRSQNTGA